MVLVLFFPVCLGAKSIVVRVFMCLGPVLFMSSPVLLSFFFFFSYQIQSFVPTLNRLIDSQYIVDCILLLFHFFTKVIGPLRLV